MNKRHGPDFRKELRPLAECGTCHGKGVTKGISYELDCLACNASGWVCADTGAALPLEDLVLQLNMKLRKVTAELSRARHNQGGAHEQYEQNNRRGAGGTNYTGD
jgi:hypothetical protein